MLCLYLSTGGVDGSPHRLFQDIHGYNIASKVVKPVMKDGGSNAPEGP